MVALNATRLLDVWEAGLSQHPLQRVLTLLTLMVDAPASHLATLSIGKRDALLLRLRERLFGSALACVMPCPACHERLEWGIRVQDIVSTPFSTDQGIESFSEGVHLCRCDSMDIRFRLPNSADLMALKGVTDRDVAQRLLLTCCIMSVNEAGGASDNTGGASVDIGDEGTHLSSSVIQALGAHMAQADPQSNVQLALTCPACHHQWLALFDIAHYLWAEINDWAQHTLRTVHTLARSYGWREGDILAMSVSRRQMYLQMV